MSRQDSINPEPEDDDLPRVSTLRIIKTNAPEWPFILMGRHVKMLLSSFDIRRRNVGLLATFALHNVFTSVNVLNETLVC